MKSISIVAFLGMAALLSPLAAAQCTSNCVVTNHSGDQTITQSPGTSLVIQGNLAPQSVDYVLHADQFSGSDIGEQVTNAFNSIACSTTGPQSVEVLLPANALLVSTHTMAPQACAAKGQRNPLRILNMNGALVRYTGTSDAFLLSPGSVSGTLFAPLLIENGQMTGTAAAANGLHIQNGGGTVLSNMQIWGFENGCGTMFEDIHGDWTESTVIENASYGYNGHQICYINNAASPGTGSFLYNTVHSTHFSLGDGEDGILVNGNGHGAQLWGGNFDIKFNVTTGSRPANVVHVQSGGSVARDFWLIRGEQTGGNPQLQNCVFLQGDVASYYNTQADILQSGITNNCGFQGSHSNSHTLNLLPDISWQPEGYISQFRATKWSNHGGNNAGYTQIFGAAPGTEHDSGLQLTSRNVPQTGNSESDTITSTTDAPIKNVMDCETASGGACGFGPGWSDTTGTGYNIAAGSGLTCSGATGTIRLASGALAASYSNAPALISGGTTTKIPTIPINGVRLGYISGTVGATTATFRSSTCEPQNGGVVYLVQFPSAAVDTTSLRIGSAAAQAQATVYSQLATFVTRDLSPRPVNASSCSDISEVVTSANGASTTSADMPFNVIAPAPLGPGPVSVTSPYRPSAGHITLRFCNNAVSGSWSPPSGAYTVVSIR